MRLILVIALILAAACWRDSTPCEIPDGRTQATSLNDRARRAQYPELTDAQFDSVAQANCWTVVR